MQSLGWGVTGQVKKEGHVQNIFKYFVFNMFYCNIPKTREKYFAGVRLKY